MKWSDHAFALIAKRRIGIVRKNLNVQKNKRFRVGKRIRKSKRGNMWSFELCAGAGGLALATSQAGFNPVALLESDPIACQTINENRRRGCQWSKSWPEVSPTDIREFDYGTVRQPISLLSGGPPCQPFSQGGKHLGIEDERNLFSEVARAIRQLHPKAFMFENTKGLARTPFCRQLRYITLQLCFPNLSQRKNESWEKFLNRLDRREYTAKSSTPKYDVSYAVHNSADYGVPQQRERIIFVGFQNSLSRSFSFPAPTHSLDSLLYQQWVTGEYWERHEVSKQSRPKPPMKLAERIKRIKSEPRPKQQPWITVRDALSSLPEPSLKNSEFILNHCLRPGARAYHGHSGSSLDLPAKALKAGRHGVPGGENMLVRPNGKVRYFTIRECAKLQGFPDSYFFCGGWTHLTRQLGNAVPISMCRRVAQEIRWHLDAADVTENIFGANSGSSKLSRRGIAG